MAQEPNENAPHCTHWEHFENGKTLDRLVRLMILMDACGGFHILLGPRLPADVTTNAGQGHKDEHSANVALRPVALAPLRAMSFAMPKWPSVRDAANVLIGFMAISLLRVIIALMEAL
jgi:hypothetical protein